MNSKYTKNAEKALDAAVKEAAKLGHTYIGSEHILLGILATPESSASAFLSEFQISYDALYAKTAEMMGTGIPTSPSVNNLTATTRDIIRASAYECAKFGNEKIGTLHLLLAIMLMNVCKAKEILLTAVSDPALLTDQLIRKLSAGSGSAGGTEPSKASHSSKSSASFEFLGKYARDLTAIAKDGKMDPVIGRNEETERLIQILSRRTKNNPCLIGEPGVGKTAVVEGLAQKIVAGNVPETLTNKQLFALDVSGMLAGSKYRGEFEERIKGVMDEVLKNPDIILFIDEIHTIVGAGETQEGSMDAANIIKPALSRGELQVIGATTITEYRKYIEKDAALERRFQPVNVGEPSPEDAVLILKGLRKKYEEHHKLSITDDAIEAAVTLSKRYIGDRYLPDKAIDLIDEAASRKRISAHSAPTDLKKLEAELKSVEKEKQDAVNAQEFEKAASLRDRESALTDEIQNKRNEWEKTKSPDSDRVTNDDIADIVTQWTGIPVKKLASEESDRLLNLSSLLHQRVIGQDEAVDAIAKAIRRSRIGLKDPNRPTGSFIFLGPTGVGKTELSKALASILFGDENAMIRIDMSEYMEKASISKMIGSPPGYVGYEEGGQLTEKIRRKPYSVVLFDEIEKAHPDVFNLLLQILDDGILTDSQGRRVDFKNSVIIMTSNLGARELTERTRSLGFAAEADATQDRAEMKERVIGHLKQAFRPEFINRIDEIIVFDKLSGEDIRKIADKMIASVAKRIASLGVEVIFEESAADYLAREGTDPVYGARPLRRTITHKVEDSFAEAMLDGKFVKGDTVTVSADENGLVWNKSTPS